AGMIPQAKWRVGPWFAVLVAWWAEAPEIKSHGVGIHFLQEMGDGHGDLHILTRFQPIAAKSQRPGNTRPVAARDRIAPQSLHHCSWQVWHLPELLPRKRAAAPNCCYLCLHPLERLWMGEQSVEHETESVGHGVDARQHWSQRNVLQDGPARRLRV